VSNTLTEAQRAFLDASPVGTIATLRPDGRIRHTLVYFALDGERIQISTEAKRGKARDVERTGWASFCVFGHAKPWPSFTVEGPARIRREGIAEPTARVLARIAGSPPSNPPSDEMLAKAGRVILELDVERVYGASYVG
jgi:PPOX class probable F420-dependent enzyme